MKPNEFNEHYERSSMPPIAPDMPCLATAQTLPRLQAPSWHIPSDFLQSLQLVVDAPIILGKTLVRPTIRPYSLDNQRMAALRTVDMMIGSGRRLVSREEFLLAKRIAAAVPAMRRFGFELAIELYVSFLNSRDPRERAVATSIALENLYLASIDTELRNRFSLRVLAYSARLAPNQRLTFKEANRLYDARSGVVHGGRAKEAEMRLLTTTGARLVRATLVSLSKKQNLESLSTIEEIIHRRVAT
jgi:hypothetical protein